MNILYNEIVEYYSSAISATITLLIILLAIGFISTIYLINKGKFYLATLTLVVPIIIFVAFLTYRNMYPSTKIQYYVYFDSEDERISAIDNYKIIEQKGKIYILEELEAKN